MPPKMDPNRVRILPAILFIFLLAGRPCGAKLRALLEEDKPNSSKVPPSPKSDSLPNRSPLDPTRNPSPAGNAKSDPRSSANPPPPSNPAGLVPPPGSQSGQNNQDKAPPKSQKSGEKDQQNKLPPSGLENKALPSPNSEERDKQNNVPSAGQQNKSPQGEKHKENGKKDNVPPSGLQTKTMPSPESGEENNRDKVPPSGSETKDKQGGKSGEKDELNKVTPNGPEPKDREGGKSGVRTEQVPPNGPEDKDRQGPKSGEHDGQDKNSKGSDGSSKLGPGNEVQEDTCSGVKPSCNKAELVACLQYDGNGSEEPFVLVHNAGENDLNVSITAPSSIKMDVNVLQLARNKFRKIHFSTNAVEGMEIVLNAGKGKCTLHTRSGWNPAQQFSAYASRLTQIHGVYFLFFTLFLAGGAWACCKFGRKRRTDNGVPYRQLEMGTQPQSTVAYGGANTSDGWDEGWDDDWDEEEGAPRTSEKHSTATVSSNGLTSRSPNKDGWDVDWDD